MKDAITNGSETHCIYMYGNNIISKVNYLNQKYYKFNLLTINRAMFPGINIL
jgi:hypothetical protein